MQRFVLAFFSRTDSTFVQRFLLVSPIYPPEAIDEYSCRLERLSLPRSASLKTRRKTSSSNVFTARVLLQSKNVLDIVIVYFFLSKKKHQQSGSKEGEQNYLHLLCTIIRTSFGRCFNRSKPTTAKDQSSLTVRYTRS